MRKILSRILLLGSLISLAACGGGDSGGSNGDSSTAVVTDNISVDITDDTGLLVSSSSYVENSTDVQVRAGLNQTSPDGPQTVLSLSDSTNGVAMGIAYPGTAIGLQNFNASTITGFYIGSSYFHIEDGSVNTGGNIDVTTYDAIGGVFEGTYSMDLCNIFVAAFTGCAATDAVNFAGSFYSHVDENLGSIGLPQSVSIDGTPSNHGMDSSFGTNYYKVIGLTPSVIYSINLAGLSATGDMDLALTDSAGAAVSCDVLAVVPRGVADPEQCQFTADSTGAAYFKVSYVAGATLEPYSISLGLPPVAEGSIATPLSLIFGSTAIPHTGSVDNGLSYYEVTGLTIGTSYTVNLSDMSTDLDLRVYLSDSTYTNADCSPYMGLIADETCTVMATGSSMWISVDSYEFTTSNPGSTFTLDIQ